MPVLNQQAVANSYPAAPGQPRTASMANVWNSRGGWFSITGAGAFVQLQYGSQGEGYWVEEILLGAGAFVTLPPNCRGVQFRNAVANVVATVTAQIAQGGEPPLSIATIGQTNVVSVASLNFQHNEVAVSTEPTLDFVDTTAPANLKFTTTDDAANTRLKLSVDWASPTVFPHSISTGPTTAGSFGTNGVFIQDAASTGGGVFSVGANSAFTAFSTALNGDTSYRLNIEAGGRITWGPGNAAVDVSLLRTGTQALQTDSLGLGVANTNGLGTLALSGRIFSTGAAGTGGIWVYPAANQFFGSVDATHHGLYNGVWAAIVDSNSFFSFQGSFGFRTAVGNGGTVTQGTSLNTGVTLNKICGQITTFTSALAGGLSVAFRVNTNQVAVNDTVIVNWQSSNAAGAWNNWDIPIWVSEVAAGSFVISYHNLGALTNSGAGIINFTIIKSANN